MRLRDLNTNKGFFIDTSGIFGVRVADGSGYVAKFDCTNQRLGLCDASPAETLDVNGNINATGVIKIDDVQVLSNRYIDSKINNNPGGTYDNPTKNLISCIKATLLAHGLVAAS